MRAFRRKRFLMRRVWFALCALALAALGTAPLRAQSLAWRITKTEWSEADEKGFGDFVRAIAESTCATTYECLSGPTNPYRASDPKSLKLLSDCAEFPYLLRAYYAWK